MDFLASFADRPPAHSLVQLAAENESESSDGDDSDKDESDGSDEGDIDGSDDDDDEEVQFTQLYTTTGNFIEIRDDMEGTSNVVDSGKLSGFSTNDPKIETIMESYTGEDNDEFMHELGEDFCTPGAKTGANPGGQELTRFNGERATRKFVHVAFKLEDEEVDQWMDKYFNQAWSRYDVNNSGAI